MPQDPQELAFASLSIHAAMNPASAFTHARAIMIRAHWMSQERDSSRVAIALADVRWARGRPDASPGVLAQALGDRVRDALLRVGAKAPPSALDDFPCAPVMVSEDVCMVSLAVSIPSGLIVSELDEAMGCALDMMFDAGHHCRRHLRTSLSHLGGFERTANVLLASLRLAHTQAKPITELAPSW